MASIPLPALDIHPPQQQDPMGGLKQMMMLKAMMGQQELQKQQIASNQQEQQLQQQKIDDQQLTNNYLRDNPTSTFGDAATALRGKISVPTYTNLMDTDAAIRQKHAMATETDLKNLASQHQEYQRIYNNVANLPDDQLASMTPQIADQINGVPGGKVKIDPAQPLSGASLQKYGTALGLQESYLKQEQDKRKELAETTEATQKGNEAAATTEQKKTETAWYAAHGGAPGVPAEQQQQAAWLAKNPGKDASDFAIAMKKIVPAFNLNMGQGLLSDQAKDMAAENYFQTGQLPAGARSPGIISSIINRAAQLHPDGSLASNKAAYEANKKSYDNVTGTLDTLSGFEKAGLANLKQFTDLADKLPDTGVPWANTPVRLLNNKMVGDQWMPAVEAARTVALREIARVTNDPKLSGTLTDSARNEVEGLSPQNATMNQIKHVVEVLKTDMGNVHQGLAQQKQDIGNRLGIKATSQQPAGAGGFWDNMPEHKN